MHHATAIKSDGFEPFGAQQESARVVSVDPLEVRSHAGGVACGQGDVTYGARRAVGCLVDPKVDDEVLVALLPDGRAYVLSVLERAGDAPLVIGVQGDCTWKATGKMSVAGTAGLDLLSGGQVGVVAGRFSLRAMASSLTSDTLEVVSRKLTGELDRVKVAATSFDGFFERVIQRARHSVRISESDVVRAERIDQTASQTLRMHGASSVLTAEQVVKIDGGQVQLG